MQLTSFEFDGKLLNKKRKPANKSQLIVYKNRTQMYCAVRKCVIVGMNQVDYEEDEGLL